MPDVPLLADPPLRRHQPRLLACALPAQRTRTKRAPLGSTAGVAATHCVQLALAGGGARLFFSAGDHGARKHNRTPIASLGHSSAMGVFESHVEVAEVSVDRTESKFRNAVMQKCSDADATAVDQSISDADMQ